MSPIRPTAQAPTVARSETERHLQNLRNVPLTGDVPGPAFDPGAPLLAAALLPALFALLVPLHIWVLPVLPLVKPQATGALIGLTAPGVAPGYVVYAAILAGFLAAWTVGDLITLVFRRSTGRRPRPIAAVGSTLCGLATVLVLVADAAPAGHDGWIRLGLFFLMTGVGLAMGVLRRTVAD